MLDIVFAPVLRYFDLVVAGWLLVLEEVILALGHGEPLDVAAGAVSLLGRLAPLPEKLRLLHSVLGGLQVTLLHFLGRGVVEAAGGPGHAVAEVVAACLVDNDLPVDESLEPLCQLVVIFGVEDVVDVEVELQPVLVEDLLHEVEVVGAVVLRNR